MMSERFEIWTYRAQQWELTADYDSVIDAVYHVERIEPQSVAIFDTLSKLYVYMGGSVLPPAGYLMADHPNRHSR
jgi:hypothetical protein